MAQAAMLAQLRAEVAQLKATVEELAQRLGRNSRNSSQPPSADPPQTPARPCRKPSGRRPGGQPGHEGQARALLPVEAVDVVIPVQPGQCLHCQHPLQGVDPQPQRHQVTEIPRLKPVVTEYQLHRLVCPVCGEATRAELPVGVPSGGFGPRVQAITALCTGAYHLSKRTTQTVLEDLFGVLMGLGTVANLEQATVQALVEPVAEARAYVQAQPAAYLDETGWREGRQRAWRWTAVTACVTVFVVRLSRGAIVAQELLGERFWGWLVTDRWSAYTWYPVWRRQVCWAHLLRDIEAMIERGGRSREIGERLRAQAHQMFHWWQRVRDGTLAHASFGTYMRPIRQEVEQLLEAGQTCGVPKTEGVCRAILKVRQALWTFVRHDGIEPTNNAAERAIRPGVLWRKGSFGTQSAEGSHFVEAMMTVVATLKQQQRHVLDYLTAACEAALYGESVPSLLPTPDALQQVMRPAA
ncbi:MAG TPA: IS66 family transposase [Candidatus Tectomicrobia bacterium]